MRLRQFPAIITDIDGVLLRGTQQIPRVREGLKILQSDQLNIQEAFPNFQMPFYALSNGGSSLESIKANSMNEIIFGKGKKYFNGDQIILSYTPLREQIMKFKNGQKGILVASGGDIDGIMSSMGIQQYITVEEYCSIFPQIVAYFKRINRQDQVATKKQICERWKIKNEINLSQNLEIQAIFLMNDVVYWEEIIQICCDIIFQSKILQAGFSLLSLINKSPVRLPYFQTQIPIYATNNDHFFVDNFSLPRLTTGSFHEILISTYLYIYGQHLQIQHYGKPFQVTFDWTEKYIRSMAEKQNIEISNFYMIGDNPKSDIRGANLQKWESILVRTGVFKGENDINDPAQYVVDDFYQAIQLIYQKEDIPF